MVVAVSADVHWDNIAERINGTNELSTNILLSINKVDFYEFCQVPSMRFLSPLYHSEAWKGAHSAILLTMTTSPRLNSYLSTSARFDMDGALFPVDRFHGVSLPCPSGHMGWPAK